MVVYIIMITEKCQFHPKAPSAKCRVCKSIGVASASIEHSTLVLRPPPGRHGAIEVHGNKLTFNLNELVLRSVLGSSYYHSLEHKQTVNEIVKEMRKNVHSAEPWVTGLLNTPSTLLCCLCRLLSLRLTEGQLRHLLDSDCPYVKIAAFLFIRLVCNPEEYWHRLCNYTLDNTVFFVIKDVEITVGCFAERLMIDNTYYSLQLPRIPAPLQKLLLDELKNNQSRKAQYELNLAKQWEKGQIVYIRSGDTWQAAELKHQENTQVHIQISGTDQHIHLADVSASLPSLQSAGKLPPPFPTGKAPLPYRSIPRPQRTRSRSRSPPHQADPVREERLRFLESVYKSQIDGCSLTKKLTNTAESDSTGPEFLNLR